MITNSMVQMFADILLKSLPENVRAMLTEENLNRMNELIRTEYNKFIDTQNAILATQHAMDEKLDAIIEGLGNDNGSGSGKPQRKLRVTVPAGNLSGDAS